MRLNPSFILKRRNAMGNYNRRVWLNKEDCFYTGSVVMYHGPDLKKDLDGEIKYYSFIEIADCHNKVRLHADGVDYQNYIDKIKLLRNELSDYIDYLEKQK